MASTFLAFEECTEKLKVGGWGRLAEMLLLLSRVFSLMSAAIPQFLFSNQSALTAPIGGSATLERWRWHHGSSVVAGSTSTRSFFGSAERAVGSGVTVSAAAAALRAVSFDHSRTVSGFRHSPS